MIISLKHNFICLNPPKTGSGFRERLLEETADFVISRYNTISPVLQKHNIEEFQVDFKHNIRHFNLNQAFVFFQKYDKIFPNINKFYIFTFVRNPWTRVESWFNMEMNLIKKKSNLEDAKNYLTKKNFRKFVHSKFDEFLFHDEVKVDFIGQMENMKADLEIVNKKLNLKLNIPEKHQEEHLQYFTDEIREFWNPELIDIVARNNEFIIKKFNYLPPTSL